MPPADEPHVLAASGCRYSPVRNGTTPGIRSNRSLTVRNGSAINASRSHSHTPVAKPVGTAAGMTGNGGGGSGGRVSCAVVSCCGTAEVGVGRLQRVGGGAG